MSTTTACDHQSDTQAPNHLAASPAPVAAYAQHAPREALEALAAAALDSYSQLRAAENWDGAADWLDALADRLADATTYCPDLPTQRATPNPDALQAAWRTWLGPHTTPWFDTYDPTQTPAPTQA